MFLHNSFFDFGFSVASCVDTGRRRTTNQDEVIICPHTGFFAVSDGMGGLSFGGKTSQMIQQKLPDIMVETLSDYGKKPSPEHAAKLISKQIAKLSDAIYQAGNTGSRFNFGATLTGVWLAGRHAVFVNLGDSRGYILPSKKRNIRQITDDHNIAAFLVRQGEITKEEARFHPGSARLMRFMGMDPPASPEVFSCDVHPGDSILLCSDGLHGMIDDTSLPALMRSSKNPVRICERLVAEANANGGIDNISVIYIIIRH